MLTRKCVALGLIPMICSSLIMSANSVSASPVKENNNKILLAQIGLTNTTVTIYPSGYDPTCGAFRATVITKWGRYTACYYNRSNREISGTYRLLYYNQPNGVWYSFENGREPSYVVSNTVTRW